MTLRRHAAKRDEMKPYTQQERKPIVITMQQMLAPGMNTLIRMHYHDYRKLRNDWTLLIRSECKEKAPPICSINIDRYYASQPMDVDNLYSSAKVIFDSLRAAGVIVNDDPNSVTGLTMTQHKVAKKKEERTVITIL